MQEPMMLLQKIFAMFNNDAQHVQKPIKRKSLQNAVTRKEERGFAYRLLHHRAFELSFGVLIVCNLVLVIIETDAVAREDAVPAWVDATGWIILFSFLLELSLRLFVLRAEFFADTCNCMDFLLVITDVSMNALTLFFAKAFPVSILRIVRLCKLSRVAKAFHVFPELRLMMAGLAGSVRAIFWGGVLIVFSLLVWSVIAVQFIHPLNTKVASTGAYADCERCHRAYASVFDASLTFCQQIIAGDSWGTITISIIEHYPSTAVFFALVFLTIGMAVLNLILGVVVDVASQARDKLKGEMEAATTMKNLEQHSHLLGLCSELDSDGDGHISREEFQAGYSKNEHFRDALTAIDINEEDLEVLWRMSETHHEGSVDYAEFVHTCYKLKGSDTSYLLAYMKFHISEIQGKLDSALVGVETVVEEGLKVEKKQKRHSKRILREEKLVENRDMQMQGVKVPQESVERDQNHRTSVPMHMQGGPSAVEQKDMLATCMQHQIISPESTSTSATTAGHSESSEYNDTNQISDRAKMLFECLSDEFRSLTTGIEELSLRNQEEARRKNANFRDDENDKASSDHVQMVQLMSTMGQLKERLERCLGSYDMTAAPPQCPVPTDEGDPSSGDYEQVFETWHAPTGCADTACRHPTGAYKSVYAAL
jgi:hypothetical protein